MCGCILIRRYRSSDCKELAALFYETVHSVNAKDYTQDQLDAWADGSPDLKAWGRSFLEHMTLIAEEGGRIVGFADMAPDGWLDRLYVHKDYQGRGIASRLCDELERESDAVVFTSHVSITAKLFFERRGYRAVAEQRVVRHGVELTNYRMVKNIRTGKKINKVEKEKSREEE